MQRNSSDAYKQAGAPVYEAHDLQPKGPGALYGRPGGQIRRLEAFGGVASPNLARKAADISANRLPPWLAGRWQARLKSNIWRLKT